MVPDPDTLRSHGSWWSTGSDRQSLPYSLGIVRLLQEPHWQKVYSVVCKINWLNSRTFTVNFINYLDELRPGKRLVASVIGERKFAYTHLKFWENGLRTPFPGQWPYSATETSDAATDQSIQTQLTSLLCNYSWFVPNGSGQRAAQMVWKVNTSHRELDTPKPNFRELKESKFSC